MTSVMVVEDDIKSMDVLCEFLQIKDLKVVGRPNDGKEAAKLYGQLHPDVVIMDVMMPKFDGFYGLDEIKKIDQNAIVIMITADLTKETERKLIDRNASAVLHKPDDLDKMIPTIEKLMEEKMHNEFEIGI